MIDEEMATACFANRLRAASRAITRHYDNALKSLDLRVSQMSVLAAVSIGKGELTIADIARGLAMDRSTLSRNFDPLVRRGLVELGPEARHRARKVLLTEAGAKALADAYPLWKSAQSAISKTVPDMPGVANQLNPIIEHFG